MGFGKRRSHVEDASEGCDYSVRNVGDRLILEVRCKDCERKASLLEKECRNRVIGILLEEPPPHSIMLSGYVETLYEDDAVLLIQMLTEIIRRIGQFKQRKVDEDGCEKCKKGPIHVFGKLETSFWRSLPAFSKEIRIQSSGLSGDKPGCSDCIESTKSDLRSIWRELSDLRLFVLRKAFRISNTPSGR